MRSSLLAAATAVLLAVTLAPASVADPGDDPGDDPQPPPTAADPAREEARDALRQAKGLFDQDLARDRGVGATGRDASPVLNQLVRTKAALPPAQRRRANALLARPTDGASDPEDDGYGVPEEEPVCGENVCIHYVASTQDAPPPADEDASGVPDAVERTLALAEDVHDTYTGSGYRGPDPDAGRGGDDRIDIYLADVGSKKLYGYCTTDQPETYEAPWNRWAYCVVDDDFRRGQFPTNRPDQNRRVTLAHEYFHAIQFAYDYWDDIWFQEATATWAEDELYDGVDDNRQYLPAGQLRKPRLPLDEYDESLSVYGQWIFFRYLSERWRAENGSLPRIVLDMWRQASGRSGAPDRYSTQAIARVLRSRNTSFTKVYSQFAVANRTVRRSYEEGRAYRGRGPNQVHKLGRGSRRTGPKRSSLDHLAGMTVRYRPRPGVRRGWLLRVGVNLPRRRTAPAATLLIRKKGGGVARRTIRLSRRGDGHRTVRFSSRRVRYVELVLVNASRRTDCPPKPEDNGFPYYACSGYPLDDFRGVRFGARIHRR